MLDVLIRAPAGFLWRKTENPSGKKDVFVCLYDFKGLFKNV